MAEATPLSTETSVFLYVLAGSAALFLLYFVWLVVRCLRSFLPAAANKATSKKKAPTPTARAPSPGAHADGGGVAHERGPDLKTLMKQSKQAAARKGPAKEDAGSHHPLFVNTLKGHTDVVNALSWSHDSGCLVTACDDLQVRVFQLAGDIASRGPRFRTLRTQRPPVGVGFGNNLGQLVVLLQGIPDKAVLQMFDYGKTPDGNAGFNKTWELTEPHGREAPLALASVGAAQSAAQVGVAVSLTAKKEARIFNLAGRELGVCETNSLANHDLCVSRDARFVAAATFNADVKVWELTATRDGFKGVQKVMDLKGHKRKVLCVGVSPDNARMVTVSEDGTLVLWNTDVRYQVNEDPRVLKKVALSTLPLPAGSVYRRVALSPRVLAAAVGPTLHFLDLGDPANVLAEVDAHDDDMTAMQWSPSPVPLPGGGSAYVLATASRDKRVRLWRCPLGE